MPYRSPRHQQLERMLNIHHELNRGAPTNCTRLGASLEVSRKTILRDLNYMRDRLNLPIDYDPQKNTYRYTESVNAFPTLQITEGEIFALLVARKALDQYRGTPFHQQLATSFEKISAGLKDNVSFSPSEELQSVSFKNIGIGKSDAETFTTLSRGITRELQVSFDYRKPDEPASSRRRVRPYHLSLRENLWYLVGFDLDRESIRTFAVPRIARATLSTFKFKRPEDFSPEKFFAKAFGVVGGDRDYHIVIRFRGAAADRVREREWHESQSLKPLGNGGVELTLQLGALEEIERWVREWGADAEVLQPPELRERLKKTAAALAKLYR